MSFLPEGQWHPFQDAQFSGRPLQAFPKKAIDVVRYLRLTSGLQLCLDAGDAASLPASATSWLDLSGNGFDFFLGTDATAQATDPSINGTAGQLAAGNYLGFDGGDYLTYDAANETWMNSLHKDNALFTLLFWVYFGTAPAAGVNRIFGNCGATPSAANGIRFLIDNPSGSVLFQVFKTDASLAENVNSGATTVTGGAWYQIAISVDEAADSGFFGINGTAVTFSAAYTTPAAGDATFTTQIGAGGNNNSPLSANSRMAMAAAWSGRALSQGEVSAFFNATRGRFGV